MHKTHVLNVFNVLMFLSYFNQCLLIKFIIYTLYIYYLNRMICYILSMLLNPKSIIIKIIILKNALGYSYYGVR